MKDSQKPETTSVKDSQEEEKDDQQDSANDTVTENSKHSRNSYYNLKLLGKRSRNDLDRNEDSEPYWCEIMAMARELRHVCKRKHELEAMLRKCLKGTPLKLITDSVIHYDPSCESSISENK